MELPGTATQRSSVDWYRRDQQSNGMALIGKATQRNGEARPGIAKQWKGEARRSRGTAGISVEQRSNGLAMRSGAVERRRAAIS